jgi:surface antigen
MKKIILNSIVITILFFTIPTPTYAAVNTYPFGNQNGQADALDPWGWFKWNCTSYAGWKVRENYISNFTNYFTMNGISKQFGNGGNWDNAASDLQLTVSTTPVVGSIAVWNEFTSYANHEYGHVAYVEAVNTNSVYVSYYNYNFDGAYHEESVPTNTNKKPNGYIIFGNNSCSNTISNTTIGSGQSYTCTQSNVTILPETHFQINSSVNINSSL